MANLQSGPKDVREVSTSDAGIMARNRALFRWPTIVQQIIDDVISRLDESQLDSASKKEASTLRHACGAATRH